MSSNNALAVKNLRHPTLIFVGTKWLTNGNEHPYIEWRNTGYSTCWRWLTVNWNRQRVIRVFYQAKRALQDINLRDKSPVANELTDLIFGAVFKPRKADV